jgi:hypothetical protein
MLHKIFIAVVLWLATSYASAQDKIDLSGQWMLTDTSGVSVNKPVSLPGTLDMAGIGTPSSLPLKMGREQLRHLTRKISFVGKATYARKIDIPKSMTGRPLTLTLERVLWTSRVAIDGQDIGQKQESLVAPHVFHLPKGLKAGQHTLQLTVDNRQQYDISYMLMAHAYTDETQTRWNGVLGRMTLAVSSPVGKKMKPKYWVDGRRVKASLDAEGRWQPVLPDTLSRWDEFSPNLHTLTTKIGGNVNTRRFGVRKLSTEDGHLWVNGRRTFLRGTLECCIFPLTGTPPTDNAGWEKVFVTARQWGLNHLRFHSYCPPDAAFRVADSLGFYLQVELPVWSLKIGKDSATCRFLREEYDRIIDNYGHHPSLCFISCGNELQPDFKFLNGLVAYMKKRDPSRLYTTTSFTFEKGHGQRPEPEDQFFVTQWTDKGWVRGQGVFDSEPPAFNKNYQAALGEISVPFFSHEIGQYAVYPNLKEISKYTGVLDPLNLKAIRSDLQQKGLLEEADSWTRASGRLAYILYKEEVERALKTPGQSGFQLLGLQDFPGQSTALVGLVDAFWDNKGACSPEEFRQACAPVTPLASFGKAVYTNDETFIAQLMVANYGTSSLQGKKMVWSLGNHKDSLLISSSDHGLINIGSISAPLSTVTGATCLTLTASIEGTAWHNSWHIWVYPSKSQTLAEASHVVVTDNISAALKALQQGRDVLLSPKSEQIKGLEGKFVPVFWSPVHFPKQAGTMGILCNPQSPAFAAFPSEANTDWQWWQLVKHAKVMVVDSLNLYPSDMIVKCVDNFANNRRLAYAFECKVGRGRLLLTSMDLLSKTKYPEARQLIHSFLKYMGSNNFQPQGRLSVDAVDALFSKSDEDVTTDAMSIYQ